MDVYIYNVQVKKKYLEIHQLESCILVLALGYKEFSYISKKCLFINLFLYFNVLWSINYLQGY